MPARPPRGSRRRRRAARRGPGGPTVVCRDPTPAPRRRCRRGGWSRLWRFSRPFRARSRGEGRAAPPHPSARRGDSTPPSLDRRTLSPSPRTYRRRRVVGVPPCWTPARPQLPTADLRDDAIRARDSSFANERREGIQPIAARGNTPRTARGRGARARATLVGQLRARVCTSLARRRRAGAAAIAWCATLVAQRAPEAPATAFASPQRRSASATSSGFAPRAGSWTRKNTPARLMNWARRPGEVARFMKTRPHRRPRVLGLGERGEDPRPAPSPAGGGSCAGSAAASRSVRVGTRATSSSPPPCAVRGVDTRRAGRRAARARRHLQRHAHASGNPGARCSAARAAARAARPSASAPGGAGACAGAAGAGARRMSHTETLRGGSARRRMPPSATAERRGRGGGGRRGPPAKLLAAGAGVGGLGLDLARLADGATGKYAASCSAASMRARST